MNEVYDKKAYIKYVLGLFAIMGALFATKSVAFCFLGPIMLMLGMRNPINLLYYLMMAIAMMMCNGHIVPKTFPFAVTQRLLMFAVAFLLSIQIFGRRKSAMITPFWGIMFFLIYMVIPSFLGWNWTISGLKLLLFTSVFLAYFGVANRIILHPQIRGAEVRSVFLAFATFFIVGSLMLIPFPSISLMNPFELSVEQLTRYISLFMGMTLHPQALGPIVTVLAISLFADLVFCVKRFNWLYVALLLISPYLVYKTGSRTAMGGLMAGLAVVVFIMINARGVASQWRARIIGLSFLIAIVGTVVVLSVPSFRQKAVEFIIKFDKNAHSSDVTFEKVTVTRKGTVDESLYNFRQSPAIGNGFQVSKAYAVHGKIPFRKLLSAPVEKGVWVTAVLEEGGVFGLIIFVGFAGSAILLLWKRKSYIALSTFITMLILNLGEMTMFSMTSTGGLVWSVIFISSMLDAQRLKQGRVPNLPPSWMPGDGQFPFQSERAGLGEISRYSEGWNRT